jgi:hypothetical protein
MTASGGCAGLGEDGYVATPHRVFRLVRIVAVPGSLAQLEERINAGIGERLGFPGMVSVHLMRSVSGTEPGLAIATIWETRRALEQYIATTGGALLDPDVGSLVSTVAVTEYEIVDGADYELVRSDAADASE